MSEDRMDLVQVQALVGRLHFVMARTVANDDAAEIERAIFALTSLSAEVERLRAAPAAGGAVTAARNTACLDRFDGKVATMLCIADRGHAGRHDYHRIENVSITGGEGEGHGPR